VVAGATYTGPLDSVYNRSFASFWRFKPRPDDGPPQPTNGFWSNNVAFRRETFARHRWPIDRRIREENVDFCRSLHAAGVCMWFAPNARLEHSPPISAGHLVRYGLSDGFNRCVRRVGTQPYKVLLALPIAAAAFFTDMVRYAFHIRRRRRAVGLKGPRSPQPRVSRPAWPCPRRPDASSHRSPGS